MARFRNFIIAKAGKIKELLREKLFGQQIEKY